VIQFLVQSYPDSLRQKICESKCFMLPIHLSLCSAKSPHAFQKDAFKALIQADPESLKICENIPRKSYTSLYLACTRNKSLGLNSDLIITVLREYMNTKNDHEEQYPLHTFLTFPFFHFDSQETESLDCCYEKIQAGFVQILKLILSAKEFHREDGKTGDVFAQPDDMGNLPLHIALTSGHSDIVIDFILQSNPGAAFKPNRNGDFPLHLAVENGYGTLVINCLMKEFPDAMGIPNVQGKLPIFIELKKQCPNRELVSRLWETFKDVGFKAGYFQGQKQFYSMSAMVANSLSGGNDNLDWLSISYLLLKGYPEFIVNLNTQD